MIEEILPNLYRIEIPLPQSPLKYLNSYLVRASGHSLLIDTGMNREECRRAMFSSLKKLGVDLAKTRFFITHLHSDHLGLLESLGTDKSTVYFSRKEASIKKVNISEGERAWRERNVVYLANGFPEDELQESMDSHPGRRWGLKKRINYSIVEDGDMIEIGDYSFRCIETPGHSPGHMCLYEADKKILVSGDHILFDITPNIAFWVEMKNPLKQYLANLEKVYPLDVNIVLPGHRRLINDHRKRIRELQEHHKARANEILSALEEGGKNTFQLVPYITWDIACSTWDEFPPQQKWFAFGETLAHLKYLEGEGLVREEMRGDKILYSLA